MKKHWRKAPVLFPFFSAISFLKEQKKMNFILLKMNFFREIPPLLFVHIPKQAKKIFISPQTIFLSINVKMGVHS